MQLIQQNLKKLESYQQQLNAIWPVLYSDSKPPAQEEWKVVKDKTGNNILIYQASVHNPLGIASVLNKLIFGDEKYKEGFAVSNIQGESGEQTFVALSHRRLNINEKNLFAYLQKDEIRNRLRAELERLDFNQLFKNIPLKEKRKISYIEPLPKVELMQDFAQVPELSQIAKYKSNPTLLIVEGESSFDFTGKHHNQTSRVAKGWFQKLTLEKDLSIKILRVIGTIETDVGYRQGIVASLVNENNANFVFSTSQGYRDEYARKSGLHFDIVSTDAQAEDQEVKMRERFITLTPIIFYAVGNDYLYQPFSRSKELKFFRSDIAEDEDYVFSPRSFPIGSIAINKQGNLVGSYSESHPVFVVPMVKDNDIDYRGTSFASPAAAAVATALLARYGKSEENKNGLTIEEIIFSLVYTAQSDSMYQEALEVKAVEGKTLILPRPKEEVLSPMSKLEFMSNSAGLNYNSRAGFGRIDVKAADSVARRLLQLKEQLGLETKLFKEMIEFYPKTLGDSDGIYSYNIPLLIDNAEMKDILVTKVNLLIKFDMTNQKFDVLNDEQSALAKFDTSLVSPNGFQVDSLRTTRGKFGCHAFLGEKWKLGEGSFLTLKTKIPLKYGKLYLSGLGPNNIVDKFITENKRPLEN